jgi:hypothetical protein
VLLFIFMCIKVHIEGEYSMHTATVIKQDLLKMWDVRNKQFNYLGIQ